MNFLSPNRRRAAQTAVLCRAQAIASHETLRDHHNSLQFHGFHGGLIVRAFRCADRYILKAQGTAGQDKGRRLPRLPELSFWFPFAFFPFDWFARQENRRKAYIYRGFRGEKVGARGGN